jgi:16S rRNA (adenine1518-N6/adenine1519-N6)-dimethyltransferase
VNLIPERIIKKYNLTADKSLGQNFLTSVRLLDRIVEQCDIVTDKNILEVGTGHCGLTDSILKQNPRRLVTVDRDERCINIAKHEFFGINNLIPILGDATKINEGEIFGVEKFSIISNLPYNVGTVLLFKWLENHPHQVEQMVLLLQKEVVDRIVARPRTKDYGRVSVLCQYLCDVASCCDIQRTEFTPPPKVTSTVVKLTPKSDVDFSLVKKLSKLVLISFSQRRKTLYNNLKGYIGGVDGVFDKLGLSKNLRAEELSVKDFVKLAEICVSVFCCIVF